MNDDLMKPLPCPFCGMAPQIYPKDPKREGNDFGQVRCENLRCAANPCVNDNCEVSDNRGSKAYQALAIRLWNWRSAPPFMNADLLARLYAAGAECKVCIEAADAITQLESTLEQCRAMLRDNETAFEKLEAQLERAEPCAETRRTGRIF